MKTWMLRISVKLGECAVATAISLVLTYIAYHLISIEAAAMVVFICLIVMGMLIKSNIVLIKMLKKKIAKFESLHSDDTIKIKEDYLRVLDYQTMFKNVADELRLDCNDEVELPTWEFSAKKEELILEYSDLDASQECLKKLHFCITYLEQSELVKKALEDLSKELQDFAAAFKADEELLFEEILKMSDIPFEFFDDYCFVLRRNKEMVWLSVPLTAELLQKVYNALLNNTYTPHRSLRYTDPEAYEVKRLEWDHNIRFTSNAKPKK